jgi:hypothetical protein
LVRLDDRVLDDRGVVGVATGDGLTDPGAHQLLDWLATAGNPVSGCRRRMAV